MVMLPPDVLAAHPEWAAIANGAGQGSIQASAVGGGTGVQNAAPTTGTGQLQGNYPISSAGAPIPTGSGGQQLTGAGVPYPAAIPAAMGGGSPVDAEWATQQNLTAAEERATGLDQAVNSLKPQDIANNAALLQAKSAQLPAQAAYLAEQQRANEAARAREQQLQTAQQDPTDAYNVARAKAHQAAANKYTYELAGLTAPIEVDFPPGYNGPIPPGVVKRIQTLAEVIAKANTNADAMDKFNTEAARIKSDQLGIAVTAADIARGKFALTLQEAELAAANAQLDVNQATIAHNASTQPPAPGLVWDDIAQSWVTQQQLDTAKAARSQATQDAAARAALSAKGPLGPFSLGDLETMGSQTPPVLSDEVIVQELQSRGYLADTIGNILGLIRARRASNNAAAGLPPNPNGAGGVGGIGGNAGGAAPAAPGGTLNTNTPPVDIYNPTYTTPYTG